MHLNKTANLLKSFTNILFSHKSCIAAAFILLVFVGSIKENLFILLPLTYLISITAAYMIGSRIRDHGINVAYNWSIKWALFVTFLYLTGTYMKDVFVYAMFLFILINTTLNPMMLVSKNKVTS